MRPDTSLDARTGPTSATGVALDRFAEAAAAARGIRLGELAALDSLHVFTRNTCYRLRVLDPLGSRVLIAGGAFFSIPAEATVAGASVGGSMLRVGWILHGFRLEVLHHGERIVTTPVRRIQLNPPGSLPGPF
jgi:hypothetical protein